MDSSIQYQLYTIKFPNPDFPKVEIGVLDDGVDGKMFMHEFTLRRPPTFSIGQH